MFSTARLGNEEKIEKIIEELKLEEKVAMCHGGGLFRTEGVKRLNIPSLKMSDGPMGVRREFQNYRWIPIGNSDDYSIYLPCNIALASTWNIDLAYEAGVVLGNEARGRGKDIILGPGINIVRSPLCGRNFEYMSEDPYLISKLVVPFIKGIQENNDVAACVKHFAVNNQETERMNIEVEVDERTLREIYLPAFEAAVKEGNTYAIMTAYNKLYGYFCSHSKYLIREILENEWGFDGVVISDWGAIHDTVEAAKAGMDIEMNIFDKYYFARPLIKAVQEGKVSEDIINEKIRKILRMMYKVNIFSDDRKRGVYNSAKHRETTLYIARESIVLLKNEKKMLPLRPNEIKTLAVIGENANITHAHGGGSTEVKALYEVTPLLGIKSRLGGKTEVKYAKGYDAGEARGLKKIKKLLKYDSKEKLINEAVELAKTSDVVIIVGGLKHTAENLNLRNNAFTALRRKEIKRYIDCEAFDKTGIELPYNQDELIKRVLEVNKNTVVVMHSGSPIKMTDWIDDASAVIQTWYNGMKGGNALAEILFGDVNPSGKLPVTFPKYIEDSPAHKIGEFPGDKKVKYSEGIYVGYRYFSSYSVKPLFCFGHGLSYTEFEYDDLKISVDEGKEDIDILVKFKITNVGDRAGAEIPQVYISDLEASVERPQIELKGFDKVYLEVGETKEVEIKLDKKALAFYCVGDKMWTVEEGKFNILIGSSSNDIRLQNKINVETSYKF